MNPAYFILGAILLVVAVVDLLWTTLWVDGGAGPLSSRLSTGVWRGLRRFGEGRSRLLGLAGPVIIVLTLTVWVGLIWAGWMVVFASAENALVNARSQDPVTWAARFYFVGYSMFTMGNGDFYPPTAAWQVAAALTTASGMLFVTMGVSYVLSVLGAVSQKRSFAAAVTGLGDRSEAVVRLGWEDDDFDALQLPLNTLGAQLDTLADQHMAYPILHYYHSQEPKQAPAMAVVIFDEALTVLRFGIPEEHQPDAAIVETARSAAQNYLETLDKAFIEPAEEAPPPPDLDRVRRAEVPTVSDGEFDAALDELNERRRKLRGVVTADAWYWPPLGENDE